MNGRALRSLLLGVLYNAIAVALVWRVGYVLSAHLTRANLEYDEKFFLWTGWSFLKGATPYRDFHAFKPPMSYLLNAAGIKLFGLDDLAYRRLFQMLAVGSILSLLAALLKRGVDRVVAASLALLVAGLYFESAFHDSSLNDTESLGLAFYIMGVAAFVWQARRRWIGEALGSALLAAAVLTKEPFALCVLPTWLAFLFDRDHPLRIKSLVAYAKPTLLGAGLVIAAIFIHLAVSGGLPYYVRVIRQYEPFARTYCVSLGSFTPGPFCAEQKQNWNHLANDFLSFPRFAAWTPLFVAAYAAPLRRRALHIAAVTVAVVGALYSTTLGHCYWRHYYVMAFAGAVLLGVVGSISLSKRIDAARTASLRWWVRSFFVVTVFFTLWPRYDVEREHLATYRPAKYGGVPADLVDFVRSHSADTDYVLVTGDPAINVMADRRAPSVGPNAFLDELLVTYPGLTDQEKLAPLRAELQRTMPKIVYLDPDREYRRARFMNTAIRPFLDANGYREVRSHMWMR